MIRQNLKILNASLIIIVLFCAPFGFAQDNCKWDSIRTEKEYTIALNASDSITFQCEFEYPFLLLLDEDEGGIEEIYFFKDKRVYNMMMAIYKYPIDRDYFVRPNETWAYKDIHPNYIVYLAKEGNSFREIQNLKEIIQSAKGKEFAWHWGDFVKKRASVSPVLSQTAFEISTVEDALSVYAKDFASSEIIAFPESILNMRYESNILQDPSKDLIRRKPHNKIIEQRTKYDFERNVGKSQAPVSMYNPHKALNKLNFYKDVAQFRDANGMTRLEITLLPDISDTSEELIALDLSNLTNGVYHLEVSVSDLGDEKTAASIQKNITIVD